MHRANRTSETGCGESACKGKFHLPRGVLALGRRDFETACPETGIRVISLVLLKIQCGILRSNEMNRVRFMDSAVPACCALLRAWELRLAVPRLVRRKRRRASPRMQHRKNHPQQR